MKFILPLFLLCNIAAGAQDSIRVRSAQITPTLYFLDCINGFGGGNVAASVGEDGILLVDDMYAKMSDQLAGELKKLSLKPVRIVLNTHYHRDHIEGNKILRNTAVIIAQKNVVKQLNRTNKESAPTAGMMPAVTFTDSISLKFNGEDIRMIHFANGHTDGDAVVYFTGSKTLHLGDMFFNGMFPAVYAEGGGDIRQLVITLDKIASIFPADAHVIPGHGALATMDDLKSYIGMLKETIGIVDAGMKQGKTLGQMTAEKALAKYDALGAGGAQTTDQYLAMLYKLLSQP